MKKFILAALFVISSAGSLFAQNSNIPNGGGGGGGSGLSVTDPTAWASGTSVFTPGGGVFNDAAVLTSGQEGTYRLTIKRAQVVDIDTTGSALYSLLGSASPCFNATAFNTNSYLNAGTNPINCDLNGGIYTHPPANQSTNLTQINGSAAPIGGGVQSTALRTTLSTDSPGIIPPGPATIANSYPFISPSQYPANATAAANPITASNTGTTGATTATLAGVASKTTFICGFTITSDATAALAGTATVTGTVTATLNYIQNVGGATAAGILTQTFMPCIPASAANTGIAINSVAAGTGGNTAVTAWGYQL